MMEDEGFRNLNPWLPSTVQPRKPWPIPAHPCQGMEDPCPMVGTRVEGSSWRGDCLRDPHECCHPSLISKAGFPQTTPHRDPSPHSRRGGVPAL